jgi:plastocyanin
MMHSKGRILLVLLTLAALVLLVSCSKKTANEESNSAEVKTAAVDKSQAGSVEGTVNFDGARPTPKKIDMSQDPVCAKKGENSVETIAGNAKGLQNVFVYVKEGFNGAGEAPSSPVTIDQEGCRYHPHVLGVMAGQTIQIKNSDSTTHNIHPTPAPDGGNREWNESQGPGAAPLEKNFGRPEVMLPVKCNQHPWMKMYINVAKNPYFAVTDADGKFNIKDLPPGDYTLAAVHESMGEKTQKVHLDPKGAQTVTFQFGGAAGAAGGQ